MKSRKLWITISVLVLAFGFCALKIIGEQSLVTIVIGVLSLYFAGNVTDKKLNGVDNYKPSA